MPVAIVHADDRMVLIVELDGAAGHYAAPVRSNSITHTHGLTDQP